MKDLSENFENKKQLLDKYSRLLRELDRLKDENRQLKEQLGLAGNRPRQIEPLELNRV